MKKEYAFLLDTGSSWNLEKKEYEDIYVVPLLINEEDKNGTINSYYDGIDISREELYSKLDSDSIISTAQANKQIIIDRIKELLEKYEKIIFLPISMDLSGFWNTLKNIEPLFEGKLIILNSKSVGIDGNWVIEDIKKELENKKLSLSSESLNAWLEKRNKRVCGSLIVNNLDQLIKSGRLKKFKAVIAKLFKIKISIRFQGDLNYFSSDLNFPSALSKSLKEINDKNNFMTKGIKRISIMNDLRKKEDGDKLTKMVLTKVNVKDNDPSLLPGIILAHTGTDTFSILIEANE